jgi:hypothetical protein
MTTPVHRDADDADGGGDDGGGVFTPPSVTEGGGESSGNGRPLPRGGDAELFAKNNNILRAQATVLAARRSLERTKALLSRRKESDERCARREKSAPRTPPHSAPQREQKWRHKTYRGPKQGLFRILSEEEEAEDQDSAFAVAGAAAVSVDAGCPQALTVASAAAAEEVAAPQRPSMKTRERFLHDEVVVAPGSARAAAAFLAKKTSAETKRGAGSALRDEAAARRAAAAAKAAKEAASKASAAELEAAAAGAKRTELRRLVVEVRTEVLDLRRWWDSTSSSAGDMRTAVGRCTLTPPDP